MRKFNLIVLVILLSSSFTFSQEAAKGKGSANAIKFNLLSPTLYSSVSLSWQHLLSDDKSIQLGLACNFPEENGGGYFLSGSSSRAIGVAFTFDYRYMLSGAAFKGFYIQPFGRFIYGSRLDRMAAHLYRPSPPPYQNNIEHLYSDLYRWGLAFNTGLVLGYQYVLKDKITLEVFLGPSYALVISEGDNMPENYTHSYSINYPRLMKGSGMRAGTTIGLLF